MTVHGQLFTPKHPTGCGLIFDHGGPSRQMLLGYHYYDTYTVLYEMNQYFVSHGCTVLSVDYRGGIMYGNAWRTFPGRGGTRAAEYQDVQGGAAFLLAQPNVIPAKVGIYGLSYGGYLTTLGVSRNSDIFHVGWEMAGNDGDAATANLATWNAPTFLEQGDDDRNVDFSDNVAVVRTIKAQKPSLEFATHVVPNEQHEMYMRFRDLNEVYDLGGQWVLHHLFPETNGTTGDVGGSVPPTLALSLGGPAGFGSLTPGVARDYTASTTANVISTAGDAALSIADPSTASPGHLTNGTFALASPLQTRAGQRGVRAARRRTADAVDLQRAGEQRRGDAGLPPAHRRQRAAAHRCVRQDAHADPVDHDAVGGKAAGSARADPAAAAAWARLRAPSLR